MPPSNFGRAGVDGDRVARAGIADRLRSGIQHQPQRCTGVERRAAHDEVVGRIAPGVLQPRRGSIRSRRWRVRRSVPRDPVCHLRRPHVVQLKADPTATETVTHVDPDDLGVVHHVDAESVGCGVIAVHHRLAAAEKERVGARQVQRAAQCGLKADAVSSHPLRARLRLADEQPRQRLIGLVRIDAQQIGEELVLRVRAGEHGGRRIVRAAEIPRVPAVPAAELAGRAFDDEDARARFACGERGTQGGVPSAEDHDVVRSVPVIATASPATVRPSSRRRRGERRDRLAA